MKILGISGSPVKNSNTDRTIQLILEASGIEYEFIKLRDYKISPCNACLCCVKTNKCIQKDDGNMLCEKVKNADAVVIGGYTPYSTLDSRTKTFLERLYPLRHTHGYMKNKPGIAVISSCVTKPSEILPPAAQMGINAIQFYMMEEGMNFLGSVVIEGNVPCIRCKKESICEMTGIKMIYGKDATKESVGIHAIEDQSESLIEAKKLGKELNYLLMNKNTLEQGG